LADAGAWVGDRNSAEDRRVCGVQYLPIQLGRSRGNIGGRGRVQTDFEIVSLDIDGIQPSDIQLPCPGD
tara:strand:- start:2924 stop:3130 length:207 start_codon:yes stop_codon:yes gene_type:complete